MSTDPRANVSRREAFFSTSERDDVTPAGAGHARHDDDDIGHDTGRWPRSAPLSVLHDAGVYLGAGSIGPAWAGTEQAVLVLGPPRSGKTSSIVVPTVLGAPGAVVSTSTKPDVLRATAHARAHGRTVPALRPERHRRRSPRRASVCAGRRWRAAARGTTRCSSPGASSGAARPGRGATRRRRRRGRRPLDRAGRSAPRPHAARRRPRRRGPRHRAVVGRPAQRRHRARDPRPQRRRPPRRPAGGDRRHRPPRAERHLVDGLGGPGRLPQRGGPGHARWHRTSTPGPSATRRPRSISVPRAGTRPWPRPWSWACSPTSAPPPTPGPAAPAGGRRGAGRPRRRPWSWPWTRWPTSPPSPTSRAW